jgi:hypothetical protein
MVSPEQTGLLKSFLGSLPEQIAARLARAVEVDRLVDDSSLPHELILQSLRPSLRRLSGAERTPTALRSFCLPFEDLFTAAPHRDIKQKGRIARGSVAAIWTWVSQTLLPLETKIYCRNFKSALAAAKHIDAKAHAESFWPIAAEAMRAALRDDATRNAARAVLGSDLVLADAEEAALLLGVGPAVIKIQETLVRPVPVLSDELLVSLRAIYDGLLATAPDAAPYAAVIAMNRLARPFEALKLPLTISHATLGAADVDLAGEIIFGDIERYADALRAANYASFDADALVENIQRFTTLSSGILDGIEMRRDGKWVRRLMRDRAALAEVMDAFMERAPRELSRALSVRENAAIADGLTPAGFGCPPEMETVERALNYARLVMGCKPFAVAGSFGAPLKQAEQEMCRLLRSHSDNVVRKMRTVDASRRAQVENQFDIDVRLTAMLFSEAEAELLRGRGRIATTIRARK